MPYPEDEDDENEDDEPCMICGYCPCTCDEQYDNWKERDL